MTNIMTATTETPNLRSKMGCFGTTVGIVLGGIALVAVLLVVLLFSKFNGINNEGVKKETTLSAQYSDNQNELSAQTLKIKESLGIADIKSDKMDQILKDAVQGRYQQGSSANGAVDGGKLFSALTEAYPDLAGLNIYDKLLDTVNAGREAFKNKQTKLLDMARDYNTWLNTGLINKRLISMAGFPGPNLKARVGDRVVTGQAALDEMERIITDADTQKAFTTGTQAPLITSPPKK